MAVFDYSCGCGAEFEKFHRNDPPEKVKCPSCGSEAKRLFSEFGFSFGDGKIPGNSGVDYLDSEIDHLVGRDAERRWESVKDRASYKRRVRRESGKGDKAPLRLDPGSGEYKPLSDDAVRKTDALYSKYNTMLETHRSKRRAKGIPQVEDE